MATSARVTTRSAMPTEDVVRRGVGPSFTRYGVETFGGGSMVRRLEFVSPAVVQSCLEGDKEAWCTMVTDLSPLILTIARAHRLSASDCDDVHQLTWLQVVGHLHQLQEPEKLAQWVATTARRECLKHISRNRKYVPTGDNSAFDNVENPSQEQPDELAIRRIVNSDVQTALQLLPPRDRLLLGMLMADSEPSYDEVSAALDIPRGSIGPFRARALRRLRELLPAIRPAGELQVG